MGGQLYQFRPRLKTEGHCLFCQNETEYTLKDFDRLLQTSLDCVVLDVSYKMHHPLADPFLKWGMANIYLSQQGELDETPDEMKQDLLEQLCVRVFHSESEIYCYSENDSEENFFSSC